MRIKSTLFIIAFLLFGLLRLNAQTAYQTSVDPKDSSVKILKGIITKYIIENDSTTFGWYKPSQDIYTPDPEIVNALKHAKDSIQFVLFGGTWCDDTQYILPKFFKLQEASGFPDEGVTFFGVDRDKQTIGNIAAAFHITNVPTIIVMKDGKEIGRVVEYGKTGYWDKELAAIIGAN
jgi:thiol-disulfide isomerase/thioredoxin